jgi:ankyrin repeat protein
MWAAAKGHSEVVEVLLKASANTNITSKAGFTPLIFAAAQGDSKAVAKLLAAGANINYAVPGGLNALSIAVDGRKSDAADVLIANGADLKAKDRTGATLLHTAAQLGDLAVVKRLIEKGADVNAKTNSTQAAGGRGGGGGFRRVLAGEQTPLMFAARGNHLEVMNALVNAGADPKLKAQDGSTLLIAAAASGHVEVVKYAYELSPDVKAITATKGTPMHAAVSGTLQISSPAEICKVVQFLADKGADLDALDANGRTPVSIADTIPIDAVVDLLTKLITASGAEPHIKSKR